MKDKISEFSEIKVVISSKINIFKFKYRLYHIEKLKIL